MNDDVIAKIGNKVISNADLERIIARYPTNKRIYFETSQGKEQLLQQKVAFSLFGMYATSKGLDTTEDFLNKINDIKEQMLTQMIMEELFSDLNTDDSEAEKFYLANPDKFMMDETVNVKHILVEDKGLAYKLKQKLDNNEIEFENAAETYSICPSKEKGGDLGYFKRGMMVKEFEDTAFSMPLNILSEPVKTQFGYHLMMVTDKTEKKPIPFDDIKDKLKEQIQNEKQQKAYEKKYEELKKLYDVEIIRKG